jgi:hypothetical protein
MLSSLKVKSKSANEAGVVSIITVVLLAMVLTLITTAFVKSTNSNRRQALDNQLSTQAFYAAETGINDVTTLIRQNIGLDVIGASTDNCTTFMQVIDANRNAIGSFGGGDPNVLDSGHNIEYTCVMVSSKVPNISVTAEKGKGYVYPIKSASSAIDKLNIKWGQGQSTTESLGAQLPNQTTWGNDDRKALIRLTLYYPATFSRTDLVASQKTFFLRPVTSGGSNSLDGTSADGTIAQVNCSDDASCSIDLTNIGGMMVANAYIRVEPIYNAASITIEAYSGLAQQDLVGAQYSIDVTGRANDVYRRIEVRRPIMANWDFPDAVAQSGSDLCKQFEVWPGGSNDVGASTDPDTGQPACPTF